jgi:glycosyltransferase involved in cell wall biosynthesis
VAKGVKKSSNQVHVCYCHTPIRYAWDMYEAYTSHLPPIKKQLVQMSLKYIKKWDIDTLDRVDCFVANSTFIQKRIDNNYNRTSVVIHPPVDTASYTLCENKEEFYVTASRLVPYKKTKLIVEAFNEIGKRLVVIGSGDELETLKKIAKENIEILGYVSKNEMISHMQRAKAFVYGALEDFGIVPIEALSCGTPVIAYGKGGVRDSVIDRENGLFFYEQNAHSIIEAVKLFETLSYNHKKISKSVEKFSKKRFQKEFGEYVEKCLREFSV